MRPKNIHLHFSIAIFSAMLSLSLFTPLSAAELSAPQLAIKTASDQMQVKMQDESFKQDFKQVSAYVEEILYPYANFDRISALVLGKHWKTATPEQRKEFTVQFKMLLVRTYARAFLAFKQWEVKFLPIKMQPDAKKVMVKTEVLQPGKPGIAINYRMINQKNGWKVYDIIIEGISLVTNYRTSFKNEIRREGSLDAVIAKMSERNIVAFKTKK